MNRQRSRWMCSICFFANLTASSQRRGVSWGCRCFSRGAAWQEQAGLLFPDSRMDGAPAHRRCWLQELIRCYSAFTNAHNYVDRRLQPGYRGGLMAMKQTCWSVFDVGKYRDFAPPVALLMVCSETTPLRCQAAPHCLSLLSLSVVGCCSPFLNTRQLTGLNEICP